MFLATFAVVAALAAAQSTVGPEIAPTFDPKDLSKVNVILEIFEN